MRAQRRAVALVAGAAMTVATALVLAPAGQAATAVTPLVACSAPAWAEGTNYPAGSRVTFDSRTYQALVAHTPPPGAGWTPAAVPALWKDLGACTGAATPPPVPTPPAQTPSAPPPT